MGEQTHSKYVGACFYGAFSSFTSFLRHFVHVYANNKQRDYKGQSVCCLFKLSMTFNFGQSEHSTYINLLGTLASRVPRQFAYALYAALTLVASKIIIFYPEVVAQI